MEGVFLLMLLFVMLSFIERSITMFELTLPISSIIGISESGIVFAPKSKEAKTVAASIEDSNLNSMH